MSVLDAEARRLHASLTTIGVTGTNGKTTTTSWIARCLAAASSPVASVTTLGSFLDDAELPVAPDWQGFLTTMRHAVDRGGRYAAIELTSQALANGFARRWQCASGVFTNLTHDHLDAHRSFEHYLASKAQLFRMLPTGGTAILNGCDASFNLLREIVPDGVRVLSYGATSRGYPRGPLDLQATRVRVNWSGTEILCEGPAIGGRREVHVGAIGEVFAENAMATILGCIATGIPVDDVVRALSRVDAPRGRFELVANQPRVVVDYAHSPDALARTCATARSLASPRAEVIVVFGAGGNRDRAKRAPMGRAASCADHVFLTSDNPRDENPSDIAQQIAVGLAGHPSVTIELNRRQAIERALCQARDEDIVLVCGKGHERTQLIAGERVILYDVDLVRAVLSERRRAPFPRE